MRKGERRMPVWTTSELMFIYDNINVPFDELCELFEHRRKVYGGVVRTIPSIKTKHSIISVIVKQNFRKQFNRGTTKRYMSTVIKLQNRILSEIHKKKEPKLIKAKPKTKTVPTTQKQNFNIKIPRNIIHKVGYVVSVAAVAYVVFDLVAAVI